MAVVTSNARQVFSDIIADFSNQAVAKFSDFVEAIIKTEIESTWSTKYPVDFEEDIDGVTAIWGGNGGDRKDMIPFFLNDGVDNVHMVLSSFSPKTDASQTIRGQLRSSPGGWVPDHLVSQPLRYPDGNKVTIDARNFDEGIVVRAETSFPAILENSLNL